jgi:hypothetical protein
MNRQRHSNGSLCLTRKGSTHRVLMLGSSCSLIQPSSPSNATSKRAQVLLSYSIRLLPWVHFGAYVIAKRLVENSEEFRENSRW